MNLGAQGKQIKTINAKLHIKNNQIKKFWLGEDSSSKSTESDPPSIKLDLPEWKCQQRILNYHEC